MRVGPLTIFSVWSALLLSKERLNTEHQTQSLALGRPALTMFPSPALQSRIHVMGVLSLHSSSEKYLTCICSSGDKNQPSCWLESLTLAIQAVFPQYLLPDVKTGLASSRLGVGWHGGVPLKSSSRWMEEESEGSEKGESAEAGYLSSSASGDMCLRGCQQSSQSTSELRGTAGRGSKSRDAVSRPVWNGRPGHAVQNWVVSGDF